MKTIQKIVLYAATGAALFGGAWGCGKKEHGIEQGLQPAQRIEAADRYSAAAPQDKDQTWFTHLDALKDVAEDHQKFHDQLEPTFKALDEAIAFDKKCEKELEGGK
ncbi:hypothetical protein KY338_06750 [Candidatus Woesearchaeota archaeon]|nr:hypothetical protein [Candidatus Woesearchaeota archaeon]MBW3005579.1 hypothetical protein [Candidatus Woesearchaeota archaeon]